MVRKLLPSILVGIFIIAAILVAWPISANIIGADWKFTFRPALLTLVSGKNPYSVDQFFIAPWGIIPFIPLIWLPDGLAMAILRVGGLICYAIVAIRLGARPLGTAFILLSPQILHNLINGNIDWLCLLGFVLPPQIGLFFVLIKPQIGVCLAIFWAVDAIKQKKIIRTFAPFLIVFLVSLGVFGLWPLRFSTVQAAYNASAWPISLPFGIVLLYVALKQNHIRIAQAISPLLSPHVMFHSWSTWLFAIAQHTTELIIAVFSSWLVFAISAIGNR